MLPSLVCHQFFPFHIIPAGAVQNIDVLKRVKIILNCVGIYFPAVRGHGFCYVVDRNLRPNSIGHKPDNAFKAAYIFDMFVFYHSFENDSTVDAQKGSPV
jgi:hypothetical protein